MKIILGSQSKGRRGVLERAGYTFEVMNADIDEKAIRRDDPKELALALAHAKADTLLPKISEPALLITSDQVIVWNGKILEKPRDADEAARFLRGYAIKPPECVSGIVVTNTATGKRREGVETACVIFSKISESVIDALVTEGDVFTRAGGFSIEHPLLKPFISQIEGNEDTVIGLPPALLERLMREVKT